MNSTFDMAAASTGTDAELRLFHPAAETDNDSAAQIARQLPFLNSLASQFEQLSGWHVNFAESQQSYRNRTY